MYPQSLESQQHTLTGMFSQQDQSGQPRCHAHPHQPPLGQGNSSSRWMVEQSELGPYVGVHLLNFVLCTCRQARDQLGKGFLVKAARSPAKLIKY